VVDREMARPLNDFFMHRVCALLGGHPFIHLPFRFSSRTNGGRNLEGQTQVYLENAS